MKERPILMSGPLVVSTLEDRKWKTRRVITPQPPRQLFRVDQNDFNTWVLASRDNPDEPDWSFSIRCPYGRVGDRLWVRETFQIVEGEDSTGAVYRASWSAESATFLPGVKSWRPSIHMPRWASRLTLEITDIQVERLQEITPRDVVAEGLFHEPGEWGPDEAYDHLIKSFAHLWNAINAKRGYCWESNPWVWVLSYKRVRL